MGFPALCLVEGSNYEQGGDCAQCLHGGIAARQTSVRYHAKPHIQGYDRRYCDRQQDACRDGGFIHSANVTIF
jgi:hypothetical protein